MLLLRYHFLSFKVNYKLKSLQYYICAIDTIGDNFVSITDCDNNLHNIILFQVYFL